MTVDVVLISKAGRVRPLLYTLVSGSLVFCCAMVGDAVHASADAQSPAAAASPAQGICRATKPNGQTPAGEKSSPGHHGNGTLWTVLWSEGTVVFRPGGPGFVLEDGALQMKFPWWRAVRGQLKIEGRRLDAPAPDLRAHVPNGYGETGFQATSLIFPTPGCWEITGRAGEASLTFVTNVVKIGEGPARRR